MHNSPTTTKNSFVSPRKPTPSRDLNVSYGKRYRLDDGDADPFAASPLIPRISTRDSILSRSSTFSHTNNSNNPFNSRRITSSPQDARRLSTMSFDTQGSLSNTNRLNVLVKSLDDFELFFKQQLRLGSHMKRGDMIELNKQCKQRITLLKQQINQVSEEDITSEDVMKEAQARIIEVFKESENWKGQASNATLHLRELENKMNDMSASYQARLKTLVDELEQSKKLLEIYENQELNDVDTDRVNEKASKTAREDAQKLSDLELKNLELKRDLQQHQAEKKELQSQVKEYSNQLIESEQKIIEYQASLEKAELHASQLNNALHSEIEERAQVKKLESELQSANHKYREAINNADKEIRNLKHDVDVLAKGNQQLQSELDLATAQQSSSISKITAERDDWKRQTREMEAKLDDLSEMCDNLKKTQEQLQSLLEKERNKTHKLKSDLADEQYAVIQLKENVSALLDEKSSLQKQLDLATTHQTESISKVTQDRNNLLGQVDDLTRQLKETNDNIDQMSVRFSQLQSAFDREVDKNEQLSKQQSESHVQLTDERNSLKRRIVDLERQLDISKTAQSEHEQELLQEIQNKASDLHRYSEQLKQLKQCIEELNQDLADKSTRLDRVTSDLEDARLQLQRSKMNEESIVQTKSNLTQRLEETAASLNQVVKEAAARDVEIARLESVRVDTRTQLENALAQHAKLEARIDQLEADLKLKDSVLSEFSQVSQELLEAADYAHKLEAVINRKEKQLAELEQEAQSLIAERDEEVNRIEQTTRQKIDQLQARVESLRNKLALAEKELGERTLENSNLEKANTDLELFSRNLKQALAKYETEMARKTRDMDELQYKYEHERDLVDDLTSQNAKLQEETKLMEHQETEIEARAKKIEKLEDTVNKILSDLATAMEKKRATEERSKHFEEMASKIKAEAQERIHDLEFECAEARRSIDDKERDLQNIRKLLREALRER
ncbi:hypothetical protein [Parasitella parasitica]|uniref:Uncharacterized protein n=1 Tax=Parasitella parasitica TaxID=35722 RepID=A0A0B7NNF5_9FUNG|nr:hypothetical protein [Parasitella parasitica]